MTTSSRLDYRSLGVAILIPFIAAGVQWLLWIHLEPLIFLLFYPAVFFSAWIGGRLGGIIATLLSAALAVYLFVPPSFTFYFDESKLYSVAIFIGMGGLFSYIFHVLKQANRRLDLMAQLQASEASLKHSEAVAHVGHWTWDVRSNRLNWSDEMYRIFGLNPIGFSGDLDEVVRMAIHPDDRQKVAQANAAVSEARQPAPLEYRVVWPDGTVRTVYAEPAEQTRDEHGQTVRLWGIVQDITERKQVEDALRDSQARLNFALEQSHTGGWDLDLVDHTAIRTLEHDRIFGYEALLPTWTYELFLEHVVPQDRAEVDRLFQAAVTLQTPWNFECRIRRTTGEVRWISAIGGHQFNGTGRSSRMAGIVQDITERKQVEEALKDSEQRFATAFNISPVAQSVIAQGSNEILAVNDTACRLFGYEQQELIGASTAKLNLWQTPAERQAAVAELQTTGHLTVREAVIRTKSDEARTVLVAIEPITWQGRPSLISSIIDITERKQAEQRVRYLARLYATLSQVNQTIVRTTDRQELFDAICQIAVDFGEFKLAWIGWFDAANGQVTPVARHGQAAVQLPIEHLDLNAEPFRSGLIGRALTGDQVAIANDVFHDQAMTHWHDFARQHNYQSIAAIPLHQQGQLVGVLNLYAADVNFFAVEEEQKLLAEMGLNISFALDTMHVEVERQQIEAALRDSEARYRLISENSADVIWVLDPILGKFTYVSPSVEKLRGYTPAEVLAQPVTASLTPESLKLVSDSLAVNIPAFMAQGGGTLSFVNEVDQPRKDGSIVHTEVTTTYLLDQRGQVQIIGVSRDITDRKRAEDLLHANLARLSLASDAAQAGFWEWDLRNNENIWSEELWKVYGLELHSCEPSYEAWQQTVHPADRLAAEQAVQVAAQNGTELNAEYRLNTAPGTSERWLMSRGRPVFDAAGQVARYLGIVIDITARKQVEAALGASEELFRAAIEFLPMPIAVANIDGTMLHLNRQFTECYGYTLEDLPTIGDWMLHAYPDPAYREEVVTNWNERITTSLSRNLPTPGREVTVTGKDGRQHVVEITARGINGLILTSLNDVTERKQAEVALRTSEERYRQLFENMNEGFFQAELIEDAAGQAVDFRFMDVNPAHSRIIGLHRDQVLGKTATELFPGLEAEWYAALAQVVHTGDPLYVEGFVAATGRYYANSYFSPAPGQFASVFTDITERKQREREMEAVVEMTAALRAESTTAAMLAVVVDQAQNLLYGAAASIAFDLPETNEELIVLGRGEWAGLTGLRVPRDNSVTGQVALTGQPYVNHDVVTDVRVSPHALLTDTPAVACVPLTEQVRTIGSLSIGRMRPIEPAELRMLQAIADIAANALYRANIVENLEQLVTERTQKLAAANERLTELDRLKSKFVSDVSHELRTPVTSLSLYIDLLEYGKPEKREQYVGKLKEQMARLHTLINDILDLSRLERDRDEGGRSPVDLNAIVEHVTTTQLIAAEAAGLTLTCNVGDDLPVVVARPDQLTRAITNLVSNAIKYTPQGTVRVQTRAHDQRVCIEVADTGLGIPADELSHLFERFYRGHAVAQSTIPGTGLGLSIVKEIVESHGGTVDVASELGKGTTFRIWLPVA